MFAQLKKLFSAPTPTPLQPAEKPPTPPNEAWKSMAIKPSQRHYDEDEEQGRLFLIELQAMLKDCDLFNPSKIPIIVQWYKDTRVQFRARSGNEFIKQMDFDDFLSSTEVGNKKTAKKYFNTMVLIAFHRSKTIVDLERQKSLGIECLECKNKLEIDNCLNNQKIIKDYFGKKISISKVPILPLRSCYKCKNGHLAPVDFRAVMPFEV